MFPGLEGVEDNYLLEACDIFKNCETYYFYKHATSKNGRSYIVGVANALHPMAHWNKSEKNPMLDFGPKGSCVGGVVKALGKY